MGRYESALHLYQGIYYLGHAGHPAFVAGEGFCADDKGAVVTICSGIATTYGKETADGFCLGAVAIWGRCGVSHDSGDTRTQRRTAGHGDWAD